MIDFGGTDMICQRVLHRSAFAAAFTMAAVMLLHPGAATAQGPSPEIGFRSALTHEIGASRTRLQLPGAGFLALETLYFSAFVDERVALTPQLGMQIAFGDFGGMVAVAGLDAEHVSRTGHQNSPLVFIHTALIGGDVEGRAAVGAGAGYRWLQGSRFAVRLQARYRRWLQESQDELALIVALGARTRE